MKPAAQIKCPNCQNLLRVPPDLVEVSLKCKHCGHILQLKKKVKEATAAASAAKTPVAKPATAAAGPAPAAKPPEPRVAPVAQSWAAPTAAPQAFPAAAPVAPAPLPASSSAAAAPSDYNPAFERSGRRYTGKGRYKGPRGGNGIAKWIAIGLILLVGGGLFTAVVLKPDWFKSKLPDNGEQAAAPAGDLSGVQPSSSTTGGTRPTPLGPLGPFPRRMLAINVANYMYMNPIQYGRADVEKDSDRRDFYKIVDRLRAAWKVQPEQTFYLTDGPLADNRVDFKHPPLKVVMTGAIQQFLATSRPQDRIVLIFAGHVVEKEGKAFLVPLEGEIEEPGTLIPLDDVYAQLAKCPAQEKLVIFDVCRYDPGRGVERPAFGEMTEGLEKALHASPPGVSVWTSCSAGQYSFEYDYQPIDMRGLKQFESYGSIFLNMFFAYEIRGNRKEVVGGGGIAQPGDPLPIGPLSEYVDQFTADVVKDLHALTMEKKEQTPKLTLKPGTASLPYDSKEALAAKFDYPLPPPTARREEVKAILAELDLPSIRAVRKNEDKGQRLADNFPFTEEALKNYADDGPTFEEIQKSPEKYAESHPVRVAAVEALVEMRRLRQQNAREELPEEFRSPINDALKKIITDRYQRIITTRQSILDEQKEKLEAALKKREMEKSKRWLATFDYAYAQVRIRLAYIFEYNLALGKVKLEQLPELTPQQVKTGGWRLAANEKMMSPLDIRNLGEEGKNGLSDLVKDHPNTPWSVLAKTQRNMVIGLKWQPSSFGAE